MKLLLPTIIASILLFTSSIKANPHHYHHPNAHAPIGVMGDHTHQYGELMVSYRYMHMHMAGLRQGKENLSKSDALTTFMVAPLEMSMDMHMFGVMLGQNDKITWMAMLPYIRKSMDHEKRDSSQFTRVTEGVGDVKVSVLINLGKHRSLKQHATLGISLPTGSVDKTAGQATRLPYPMQIGTGTTDLHLAWTGVQQNDTWSMGTQLGGRLALDRNKHDYAWGNRYSLTSWIAKNVSHNDSVALRINGKTWDNIRGEDSDVSGMTGMVPTALTTTGGQQIDVGVSWNHIRPSGHRIAAEVSVPVFQDLNGTQLKETWVTTVGWQKAF